MPQPTDLTPVPEFAPPLTAAEKRRRRQRSVALAIALGLLVALFYAVTIAKLGANAIASNI